MKKWILLSCTFILSGMATLSAADLDLQGNDQTLATFSGVDNVTNTGGAATLTVAPTTDITFAGAISGNTNGLVSVVKTESGTWTVTSNQWTNLENLEIQAGTMKIANSGNLDYRFIACPITVTGENSVLELAVYNPLGFWGEAMSLSLVDGGTLHLSGAINATNRGQQLRGFAVSLNNGHITVAPPTQTGEMEQFLYTSGGVTIQSGGTSDIAAAFDMRGTLTTNVTDGTLTLTGRMQDLTTTRSALVKTGAGTLILANSGNNYLGETQISAGTLQLGAENAISTSSSKVTLNSTVDLAGFDQTLNNWNGNANGKMINSSATPTTLTVNITNAMENFAGQIQGDATGKIHLVKTGAGIWNVWTNAVNLPWRNLEKVTVSEGTFRISQNHVSTNSRLIVGAIEVLKDAVLDLAAENALANNYLATNTLTLSLNGGTMTSTAANKTQLLRNTDILLNNGTISDMLFYFASDSATYDMTLTSSGNSEISATVYLRGASTWDVADGVLTCSGIIRQDFAGTQAFTKTGAGELKITNAGNLSNMALNIADGGLFLDGGKWNGNVTLAEGTTFSAAGNATITETLTLHGDYQIDLLRDFSTTTALTAKQFLASESASMNFFYDGVLLSEVDFVGEILAEMEPFPLLTVTNHTDEAFLSLSQLLAQNPLADYYLNLSTSENTLWLSVDRSSIPEPTTWSLIMLGCLWLGYFVRKREQKRVSS
ncbi:MAG: autotransporter-associated beta strand repeat-containing protein [Planctomycetia bacterium]|nr:autotransporter-associated beta strand repeat-containing protein [Planctomycetia bacterium]